MNRVSTIWYGLLTKAAEFTFSTTTEEAFYRKYPRLYRLLGAGMPTHAGRAVNERTALNCSTVWACQRVIAETLASLPLLVMRQTADGKFPATDLALYSLLHDEPNPEMSDMNFRESLTAHAVTWGNGYARVFRRSGSGEAMELWPLSPSQVTPDHEREGRKRLVYVVHDGTDTTYTVQRGRPHDIFHLPGIGFDGTVGYSVVEKARQSIALAEIQDEYTAKFFAAGGRKPYYLKKGTKFKTDQDFARFRDQWEKTYAGADNFHKAPILEGDIELKELGMPLQDAQLLASRQFSVPEICRWFRISPHLVADLSRATFSNIEQLAMEFVSQTLMPWAVRWEKAIRRCILTDDEKQRQRLYAKHNFGGLLRGDFASRMSGYATALQNGHLSINEVRDLEDRNPIEGGDDYHIQLNMQSLPGGTPLASQQTALIKVGSNSGGK